MAKSSALGLGHRQLPDKNPMANIGMHIYIYNYNSVFQVPIQYTIPLVAYRQANPDQSTADTCLNCLKQATGRQCAFGWLAWHL
jgi:hypothetical protein